MSKKSLGFEAVWPLYSVGGRGGVNIHKICIPNLEQKKIKYFNHGNQFSVSDGIYLNKQHN